MTRRIAPPIPFLVPEYSKVRGDLLMMEAKRSKFSNGSLQNVSRSEKNRVGYGTVPKYI